MKRGLYLWCGVMLMTAWWSASFAETMQPTKDEVDNAVSIYIKAAERQYMKENDEHAQLGKAVVADLNGDGKAEIILWVKLFGPTYWNNYVAVLANEGDGYKEAAQSRQGLGAVQDIGVRDGWVDVHTKVLAKGDANCCPTLKKLIKFKWEKTQLVEINGSSTPRSHKKKGKATAPNANKKPPVTAWEIRPVSGRPPVATVKGPGVVESVSLMCNEGRPVVALVVKAKPPQGPVSFSLSIAGRDANLSLVRANSSGKLLMGDLSRSTLPRWLAAHNQGRAALRINGGLQGKLNLSGAATASRSALQSCYRY